MPTLNEFTEMNADQLIEKIKSCSSHRDFVPLQTIAEAIRIRNQSKDLDSLMKAYRKTATAGLPHLEGISEFNVVLTALGPCVVPQLIRLLLDPGGRNGRDSVAAVLRDIKDERALEPLQQAAIRFGHERDFSRMAANAIHCLGGTPPSQDQTDDAGIQKMIPIVCTRGTVEQALEIADAIESLKRYGKRVISPLVERILQTVTGDPLSGWSPGLGEAPALLLFQLSQDPDAEVEIRAAIDILADHVCGEQTEPKWNRMYAQLVLAALTKFVESSHVKRPWLPSALNRCVTKYLKVQPYNAPIGVMFAFQGNQEEMDLDRARRELVIRWCRLGTTEEQTYAWLQEGISRLPSVSTNPEVWTAETRNWLLNSGEVLSKWCLQLIENSQSELCLEVLGTLETAFVMIERSDLVRPLLLLKSETLEKSGKYAEALAACREYEKLCIEANDLVGQWQSLGQQSLILEEMQDYPAARAAADVQVQRANASHDCSLRVYALCSRAILLKDFFSDKGAATADIETATRLAQGDAALIARVNGLRTSVGLGTAQPFASIDVAMPSEVESAKNASLTGSQLKKTAEVITTPRHITNPDDAARINCLIHEARNLWAKHRTHLIWWQRFRCPAPALVSKEGTGSIVTKWEKNLQKYKSLWEEWFKRPRWHQMFSKPPAFPDLGRD